MKTAAALVKQYLDNPYPRWVVNVQTQESGTMALTFIWMRDRWYLEIPQGVSAIECNRINKALDGTQWQLYNTHPNMPDLLQDVLNGCFPHHLSRATFNTTTNQE